MGQEPLSLPEDDPTEDRFGNMVALDGNNVLIGAFLDDTNGNEVGQAHLFDLSGNLLQTFNDPTPTTEDQFGRSLALDGNNVIIGALKDDTLGFDVGQAHLFDLSGSLGTSSVDFVTADGTATAGSDYVAVSGTLQFLAGEMFKSITVQVNGDSTIEPDEDFVVNLSNATGATIADSQGLGTILDDDAHPIPNDPLFPQQWQLNNTGQAGGPYDIDMDLPAAWSVTTGSMSTVIALNESGIEYTHEDLYLNIWINEGEIPAGIAASLTDSDADGLISFRDLNDPSNAAFVSDLNATGYIDAGDLLADPTWEDGVDTDGNGYVDDIVGWDFFDGDNDPSPVGLTGTNQHGTGQAGKIGAVGNNGVGMTGINWNIRMMSLRVRTTNEIWSIPGAVSAIDYAVAMGVPVSLNSYGGFESDLFSQEVYDAIDRARLAGHLFVAPIAEISGQGGVDLDIQPYSWANYDLDNILLGLGTDEFEQRMPGHSWGAQTIDVILPTRNSVATTIDNSYAFNSSGNSATSALLSGVAALVHSAHPEWGYAEIKAQIMSTVDPVPGLVGLTVTGGSVNAAAAVSTSSIHVTDPVLVEGNSGTSNLVFTVSRRGDTSQSLTLDWSTADGTATAGSDYVAGSGQVTFGVDVTQQTISVVVNGDDVGEADETLFLNLGIAAGNTTIADTKSQGTIQDDDVVGMTVTGVSPDSAGPNEQLTVTVTGIGFVDGATVDFGTRVNVQSVTFVSAMQLDVLIKVHRRASTGPRDVTVTNPDSSTATCGSCFTVGVTSAGSATTAQSSGPVQSLNLSSNDETPTDTTVVQPTDPTLLIVDPALTEEEPDDETLTEEDPAIVPEDQTDLDSLFGNLDGSLQEELLVV